MVNDAVFKVCIFGDGGVGKTTLVQRYLTGVFNDGTDMTIGVDFHVKKLNIEGKTVALQIWDFAGERRFRFLLPSYVRGTSGGIFMFDMTRYSSIKNILEWLDVFKEGAEQSGSSVSNIPLIMVAGKSDLAHKRVIEKDSAISHARENKFHGYIECSSMSGENVEQTFEAITKILLKRSGLID